MFGKFICPRESCISENGLDSEKKSKISLSVDGSIRKKCPSIFVNAFFFSFCLKRSVSDSIIHIYKKRIGIIEGNKVNSGI